MKRFFGCMLLSAALLSAGKPPKPAKQKRILSDEEKHAAFALVDANLGYYLDSPATASWPGYTGVLITPSAFGNGVVIRLYVTAQNLFGALLTEIFTCRISEDKQHPENLELMKLKGCHSGIF